MTQYPECYLARELEICYCNISLITDYDAGMEDVPPVTQRGSHSGVQREQQQGQGPDLRMIPALPTERACVCAQR